MKQQKALILELFFIILASAVLFSAGEGGNAALCSPPCQEGYICQNGECIAENVNVQLPICGNGVLDQGEECEVSAVELRGGCPLTASCSNCRCQSQWLPLVLIAFLISASLISLLYMGSSVFNITELKTYTKDELTQLIFTALILASLTSMAYYLDASLLPAFKSLAGGAEVEGTFYDYAFATLEDVKSNYEDLLSNYLEISKKSGQEGSKSGYCSILGVGYSIITCSAINAMRPSITHATTSLSLAVTDFQAIFLIMSFAKNYAFSILLPIGIFLRTFNFTRKVGGTLIAFAAGLYLVLPLTFLFSEKILFGEILDSNEYLQAYRSNQNSNLANTIRTQTCDPFDFSYASTREKFIEPLIGQTEIGDNKSIYNFEPLIFQVYLRSIFATALNLTITLLFIQWLAAMFGSQIDISTLVRLSQ
ncbi:MAG: hypothetical protein QXN01_00575 [Candidatus Anstonellales archaeon]